MRTDRVVTLIDHGKNQVTAGSFHEQNHLRSGEHARPLRPEKRYGLIIAHLHNVFSLQPYLVFRHRFMQTILARVASGTVWP